MVIVSPLWVFGGRSCRPKFCGGGLTSSTTYLVLDPWSLLAATIVDDLLLHCNLVQLLSMTFEGAGRVLLCITLDSDAVAKAAILVDFRGSKRQCEIFKQILKSLCWYLQIPNN